MSDATAAISREIAASGVISFARFMELSLYCPETGYYEQGSKQIGCQGDFYTSVSVGSVFGELLAFQCARWIARVRELMRAGGGEPRLETGDGEASQCRIVEAGAHDGTLARDILEALTVHFPDTLNGTEYWIIEPSGTRRQRQEKTLSSHSSRVRWWRDWREVRADGVDGVILSNELLDAFPVHRIGWDVSKRRWFEWGVGEGPDGFRWERIPVVEGAEPGRLDMAQLPTLPDELLEVLPDGFTTEIGPAAVRWWEEAAAALRTGVLCTLDYGLASGDLFSPGRAQGTLRAYRGHRVSADLLGRPGEQDLTAHVNFTAIQEAGESTGLRTEMWCTQERFLTRILQEAAAGPVPFPTWTPSRLRQFQSLTHPEHLGASFRVLVQSRRV